MRTFFRTEGKLLAAALGFAHVSACIASDDSAIGTAVSAINGLRTTSSAVEAPNDQFTGWTFTDVGDQAQISPDGALLLATDPNNSTAWRMGLVAPLEQGITVNATDGKIADFDLDALVDTTKWQTITPTIADPSLVVGLISALAFDPRYGPSAIRVDDPSDCDVEPPAFAPEGGYECRKLLVYAQAKRYNLCTGDHTISCDDWTSSSGNCSSACVTCQDSCTSYDSPCFDCKLPCVNCQVPIYIVVAPLSVVTTIGTNSDPASRSLASISPTPFVFERIKDSNGNDILIDQITIASNGKPNRVPKFREHLTATADGRLLVYWDFAKGMRYTYGADPVSHAGYTVPKSLWDISKETTTPVQGGAFGDVYPIAKQLIKYPDGLTVPGDGGAYPNDTGCGYPWITPDGSSVFCMAGNLSALITFGAETEYYIKHVDGQVQTTQGRYCDQLPGTSTNCTAGTMLCSNAQGINGCNGEVGLQNLTSLGAATGFWRPVTGQSSAAPLLPLNRRLPTRSMVARNTALKYFHVDPNKRQDGYIYFEVPNDDFQDPAFDLVLHMNEAIDHDNKRRIDKFNPFRRLQWLPLGTETPKTADTSGHGYLASLRDEAQFPFEKNGSLEPVGTPNPGFVGRAVHFNKSSRVTLEDNTNTFFAGGRSKVTIELAINPESSTYDQTNGTALVQIPAAFTFGIDAFGDFVFEMPSATNTSAKWLKSDVNLPLSEWTHLAITYEVDATNPLTAKVRLLKNAQAIGSAQTLNFTTSAMLLPPSGNTKLCIGPGCNGKIGPSTTDLWIDEVAISNIVRSDEYLAAAAFVHHEVPGIHAPAANDVFPPLIGPLPEGLVASDIRVPNDVLQLFTSVPNSVTRKAKFDAISALGASLFADTLLSLHLRPGGDQSVRADYVRNGRSCATCHVPATAFANQCQKFECELPLPTNNASCTPLPINTPTLINRAFSIEQFLDKRSPNLLAQVLEPVQSAAEMGGNLYDIANFINVFKAKPTASACPTCDQTLTYRKWFRQAFDDSTLVVSKTEIAQALTVYLLGRVAGGSPVDFIRKGLTPVGYGQLDIPKIVDGMQLFEGKARCSACHQGPNFSDELLHASGPSGIMTKTPTLRHLDKTPPYFRDGSKNTLNEVVEFYSSGACRSHGCDPEQFPLGLTAYEKSALVAFLEALGSQSNQPVCAAQ